MTIQVHARKKTKSLRIAAEIRAEMARQQISGRRLAEKMERSPNWVSLKTSGASTIDFDDLEEFAEALGVTSIEIHKRATLGNVSVASGVAPVTVSGRTPWPDHPVVASAATLYASRPNGPPPSATRTFPTGR